MADKSNENDRVSLVTTDTFTPYKKDEVFTVSRKEADQLLTPNLRENDFGPIYPVVKVRLYDEENDAWLLLKNNALNQKEREALEAKLKAGATAKK